MSPCIFTSRSSVIYWLMREYSSAKFITLIIIFVLYYFIKILAVWQELLPYAVTKYIPKGRHFAAIVYTITDKVYNDWYQETIYTIEQIGFGKHIIDGISEDTLNKDYVKIK